MTSLINGEAVSSRKNISDINRTASNLAAPITDEIQFECNKLVCLDLVVGGALYTEPVSAVRYAIKWGKVAPKCSARLSVNLIEALVHHAKTGDPTCRLVLQWLIARQSIEGADLQQARHMALLQGGSHDQA